MKHSIMIGLDIGTSGAKCIAIDETGAVLASSTHEYPLYTPKTGWAEQVPEDWWQAVCDGLRVLMSSPAVDKSAIVGVSFSGQMHGLVPLDKDNNVIRPSILWCDQRTQKQCDHTTEVAGGPNGLLGLTNNRMLTGYTGGKILWMRDEEPEAFTRMTRFICPKDYIRLRMTGELGIDVSDASGTGLFDTVNRRWSDKLISLLGLDPAIFPEVRESVDLAGVVSREVAESTGLPEGTKVYYGGGDAVIQTTGAGLVRPGVVGVVIGTAGNVSMALDKAYPNPNGDLQIFGSNEPGLWHALGCTLNAGGAYRWYRDVLCADLRAEAKAKGISVYDLMNAEAEASKPGANGVIFTPYLSGERCPYPDANVRGSFLGLSLPTNRGDMTRAVMEGVTYSLKQVMDLMSGFAKFEKIVTSGGGSVSPLWRQMQADIFGLPVYTMSASGEGGAYGACMAAGVGAGVWKDLNEAATIVREETETLPIEANREAYREAYERYGMVYGALKGFYDR